MTRRRGEWLDRLAMRSLSRPVKESSERSSSIETHERFSRATSVKLAVAGAASLALGGWRATPLRAQGPAGYAECYEQCEDTHDKDLDSRIDACYSLVGGKRSAAWDRLLAGALVPPAMALNALAGACLMKEAAGNRLDRAKCRRGCAEGCRRRALQSSRSLQGRSGATCEVTPPRKGSPPTIPPAPNPADDPCGACNQNGDKCCGSCPQNPLAAACVGVYEGVDVVDCATALATQC